MIMKKITAITIAFALLMSTATFATDNVLQQTSTKEIKVIEAEVSRIEALNISESAKIELLQKLMNKSISKKELEKLKNQEVLLKENNIRIKNKSFEQNLIDQSLNKKDFLRTSNISAMSSGSYPTRKGAILVTTDQVTFGIQHGHAGIVYDYNRTIESLPVGGVQKGYNTWNTQYNAVYGVTVKNTTYTQDEGAANWCYNQIGKAYNWVVVYIMGRDKLYCSQLVWAAYKYNFGIDCDDSGGVVWPIDLVNSNKVSRIYTK